MQDKALPKMERNTAEPSNSGDAKSYLQLVVIVRPAASMNLRRRLRGAPDLYRSATESSRFEAQSLKQR